jgi:hypothetical protein
MVMVTVTVDRWRRSKSKVHHESPEQSKADLRMNDKEIILMFLSGGDCPLVLGWE